MAMVKKLSLQGVRSFSPAEDKGQWIEFGSPLTLILGVNGSGKTVRKILISLLASGGILPIFCQYLLFY